MLIFNILFDEVDRGPRHEKKKNIFSCTQIKWYYHFSWKMLPMTSTDTL